MEKKKARARNMELIRKQAVLNISVVALVLLILNFSISIYPFEGMQTRNTSTNFRWVGFASYALVDDNPWFVSPVIVKNNKTIELEPGTYYWCVPFLTYCLKKTDFEVQSEVSLTSKEINSGEENATYYIENTGNVKTYVEINNALGRLITGLFVLEPSAGNVVEINETAEIVAKQE